MSDLISRQAAIDVTTETVFVEYEDGDPRKEESIILQTKAAIRDRIKALPSVQPETATVTIGRTRGETTMWYECDACGEPVDVNDNYCRNCGRKLIHD